MKKIHFDINHPAHVHFFKNLIWKLLDKGVAVSITASDKDVSCELLDNYGFTYTNLGSYGGSPLRKLFNIPAMDWKMINVLKKEDPDVVVGLASVRAAHASFFLKKKSINYDDTENGTAEVKLYLPFVSKVCTPSCYQRNLGPKQVRYNGYHELAYLHPDYFTPDPKVLEFLKIRDGEPFVIMRFVSWSAVHDVGHKKLSLDMKRKAIAEFEKHAKVFITSERPLSNDLEKYRIGIPPEKLHHALYYASLLYGESATMASESSILGTPSIYLDKVGRGYTDEQEKVYGTVFNFGESFLDQEQSIQKGVELLTQAGVKAQWREKASKLVADKIDVTAWMSKFIQENF